MFQYNATAAQIAQGRAYRNRLELLDSPLIHSLDNAGCRMGIYCRADASGAVRAYVERKKGAIAAHYAARQPFRPITVNGRSCNYGKGSAL